MLRLKLFTFLLISLGASAQGDWHDLYKKASYSEVIEACDAIIPDDSADCEIGCFNYSGMMDMKFKTLVTYEDSVDVISGKRAEFLKHWLNAYWPGGEYSETFQHDMFVKYNNHGFWVFVQEPTLPFYSEELEKGDEMYLYLLFAGTLVINNEEQYIFVANDFEKK